MRSRHPNEDNYELDCTRIDDFDLNAEYVRLPSDLAYWGSRYAAVYQYWLTCKETTQQTRSNVASYLRLELEKTSPKRVTIAEVEELVMRDAEVMQARAKEIAAEGEKIRIYGILDAIRAKKDMLVSLGANMRAEREAIDLTIRSPDYVARQREIAGSWNR